MSAKNETSYSFFSHIQRISGSGPGFCFKKNLYRLMISIFLRVSETRRKALFPHGVIDWVHQTLEG